MNEELRQINSTEGMNTGYGYKRPIDKIRENFNIFGIASFIYACFFTFCMHDDNAGIAFVLCVAGSIFYVCFMLKKLEIKLKKGSIFYIASMVLVSISTFCTDDIRIIEFNKIGIMLLGICLLLDALYDTSRWGIGKFISSIVSVCVLSFGEICSPFEHAEWYVRNKWNKKNAKYIYLLIGVGIAVPLFIVAFLLLSSADVVFRDFFSGILTDFSIRKIVWICFVAGFMFMASYCIFTFASRKSIDETVYDKVKYESLVAIPVVSILTALYLVFSIIQIMYLFIGNMKLPDGYTYAEYAREGFFQLLIVSILNLVIVLVCLCFFKSSKVLKGILIVMSFCTIIMITSSAVRMFIYIQYYYLTFLRIMVLWSLLVLLFIFAGVISYIFYKKFPLLRYSVVVVTVLYIGLAFSHPDYIIAKVNLAGTREVESGFFRGDEYDDFYMIGELNADAAPAITEWIKSQGYKFNINDINKNILHDIEHIYTYNYITVISEKVKNMGLRDWNISLAIADNCMEDVIK